MADKFIYCPRCESDKISETDYEELNEDTGEYEEDVDGRACDDCGWEGDRDELICNDEEGQ